MLDGLAPQANVAPPNLPECEHCQAPRVTLHYYAASNNDVFLTILNESATEEFLGDQVRRSSHAGPAVNIVRAIFVIQSILWWPSLAEVYPKNLQNSYHK